MDLSDKYECKLATYRKKHLDELKAVLINFASYMSAVKMCGNHLLVKAGYIHIEPNGIIAIDQKGGERKIKKLQQTRLYLFPNKENRTVYVLTIGNKNSQQADIKWCGNYIKKL